MIFYIENLKDTTRKLLELINEYSKFEGYKINTQKSFAFLYTNNEKEKAMATHYSTLAWKCPWREEPGRLQSMGLLGVGHD